MRLRDHASALRVAIARRKLFYCALAYCFVVFAISVMYDADIMILAGLVALIVLCAAALNGLVALVLDWKDLRFWAVLPIACCALTVFVPRYVGDLGRELLFMHNLPRYEALVHRAELELRQGTSDRGRISLSEAEKEYTYFVSAQLDSKGNLVVEIATGGGFPVRHSGYVFSASGALIDSKFQNRWPYQRQVRPQWFRVMN